MILFCGFKAEDGMKKDTPKKPVITPDLLCVSLNLSTFILDLLYCQKTEMYRRFVAKRQFLENEIRTVAFFWSFCPIPLSLRKSDW